MFGKLQHTTLDIKLLGHTNKNGLFLKLFISKNEEIQNYIVSILSFEYSPVSHNMLNSRSTQKKVFYNKNVHVILKHNFLFNFSFENRRKNLKYKKQL